MSEDHINIIKKRIKLVKEEIKEGEKNQAPSEAEENPEEQPDDAPVARKSTSKKKKPDDESSEGETLLYDHEKYNILVARQKRYELAFNYA